MPLDFNQELKLSEEEVRWTFWGTVCFFLILAEENGLFAVYWTDRSQNLDVSIIIGILATTVVLILASTYFYAYRFFQDVFFLFISVGWFANGFYLPFEFFVSGGA